MPFIVASRNSNKLLKNLCEDNAPIIFEGHHSSYFLNNKFLKGRNRIVRTHNIESNYYKNLSEIEGNLLKKIYLFIEAKKLKRFDKTLSSSTHIATITNNDKKYYSSFNKSVSTLSAFHPFKKGQHKFIFRTVIFHYVYDYFMKTFQLEEGAQNKAAYSSGKYTSRCGKRQLRTKQKILHNILNICILLPFFIEISSI